MFYVNCTEKIEKIIKLYIILVKHSKKTHDRAKSPVIYCHLHFHVCENAGKTHFHS